MDGELTATALNDDGSERVISAELQDALPDISEAEIAFVRDLMLGRPAIDAFRKCFPQVAETLTLGAAYSRAARLAASDKIQTWLHALRTLATERFICEDAGQHVAQLTRLRELAIKHKQFPAAVAAEKSIGYVSGLYVDGNPLDPMEKASTSELIKAIEGSDPALAAAARRLIGAK